MHEKNIRENILGLFKKESSRLPVVFAFNYSTSTWSSVELKLDLAEDVVQLVVLQNTVIALTSSGDVLSCKTGKCENKHFTLIDEDCIKLLQNGNHCFGFFREGDHVKIKCVQQDLGSTVDLGVSMERYFASCSRLEENGSISLYVAGKSFKTSASETEQIEQTDSRDLVKIIVNPSGSLESTEFLHYNFPSVSCSIDIKNGIVSLWLKGLTEVIRLDADTLTMKRVDSVNHQEPLVNKFIYPNEIILHSSTNEEILFHRKSFMTFDGECRELHTYELASNENDEQRYWRPVSTFFRADLLSIFDGKFAFECHKL